MKNAHITHDGGLKKNGLAQRHTYKPTGHEVQEANVLFAGEYIADEEDDNTIPIRTLDNFTFFNALTLQQVSLLNILMEEVCRDWVGVGDVEISPFATDEDDEEPRVEGVRLTSILDCSVHWISSDEEIEFEVDDKIYVRTQYAWYILLRPAREYAKSYHDDMWINHRLTHGLLVSALQDPRTTYSAVLSWLQSSAEHEIPELTARIKNLSLQSFRSSEFVSYLTTILDSLHITEPEFCRRVARCAIIKDLCPSLINSSTSSQHNSRKRENIEKDVLRRLNSTVVTPRVASVAKEIFSQSLNVAHISEESDAVSSPDLHCVHLDNPTSVQWVVPTASQGIYQSVMIDGVLYSAGDIVIVEPGSDANKARAANAQSTQAWCSNTLADTKWFSKICYLFEDDNRRKKFHAQWLEHGSKTVLQEAAHSRGLFWLMECADLPLDCILSHCNTTPWPTDKLEPQVDSSDENQFFIGLTLNGADHSFFNISSRQRELALACCDVSKPCVACGLQLMQEEAEDTIAFGDGVSHQGVDYHVNDFVYLHNSRHSRLLDIAQITGFICDKHKFKVHVRRYGRYDRDLHNDDEPVYKDNRRLFMTEVSALVDISSIEGKAFVACPLLPHDKEVWVQQEDHFYCDLHAESLHPSLQDLHNLDPAVLVQCDMCHLAALDVYLEEDAICNTSPKLRGLDLFAGAGGLSTGLNMSGFVETKWAVEFSPAAAKTYKANHKSTVVYNQCSNLLLEHAIATAEGRNPDTLWCYDKSEILPRMPLRGEVDFIYGGPPCQSFSRLNHNRRPNDMRSTLVCNMISYVEFYRPMYFLLENVAGLLDHKPRRDVHKGVVKFILRSLIALGYQVRFRLLQAAQYGAPQARRRVIFLGARRDVPLPDFPLPQYAPPEDHRLYMHKVTLPNKEVLYPLFRCGEREEGHQCAPLPAVTVDDAIGDLPKFDWVDPQQAILRARKNRNEDSSDGTSIPQFVASSKHSYAGYREAVPYSHPPLTRYQNWMREGNGDTVSYHYNRGYYDMSVERVVNIPMRAGANHTDLPKALQIPRLLDPYGRTKAKSIFGRLDGKGQFVTALTDVNPVAKGGRVLHPNQKRVITVRECARAQGFPDDYVFLSNKDDSDSGRTADQLRQIGNAVPIPLALALGKEVGKAFVKLRKQQRDQQERERQLSPEAA